MGLKDDAELPLVYLISFGTYFSLKNKSCRVIKVACSPPPILFVFVCFWPEHKVEDRLSLKNPRYYSSDHVLPFIIPCNWDLRKASVSLFVLLTQKPSLK